MIKTLTISQVRKEASKHKYVLLKYNHFSPTKHGFKQYKAAINTKVLNIGYSNTEKHGNRKTRIINIKPICINEYISNKITFI